MNKKLLAISLSIAMLAGMMAGCSTNKGEADSPAESTGQSPEGGTDKPAEGQTLTFWNGFTSTDGDVLKEISERYNADNEYATKIAMDVMPWDTFNEKLPAAIASSNAPDFVLCSSGYYSPYIEAGSFQDTSDYFEITGASRDEFDENVLKLLQYDDLLVGIPMQMVSHYLFWDKDLFEAAGLDPDTPPASLEQMKEYAGKLTDSSKNQYGFLIPSNNNVTAQYIMYGFGADYTVPGDETKAALNSPESVRAFEWMKEVYVDMKASPSDSDDNTFISGQLGMFINGPWIINGLRENEINFGVTAVPAAEGNEKGAAVIPVGFSIPKTTPADRKELIYDFVHYWNSPDVCTEWTQRCGTPAYLKAAQENLKDDETTIALSEPLSYGRVVLKKVGVSQVAAEALYPSLEEIFAGADIQSTLDKYNGVAQGLLK